MAKGGPGGDHGAPLAAGMVVPYMGSTLSCSHCLHFQLLCTQAVSAQGIPPGGASPALCEAPGCGEVVQKQPMPLARRCLVPSQWVGWHAVSQTTRGLAGEKFQIFIDLPSSFA